MIDGLIRLVVGLGIGGFFLVAINEMGWSASAAAAAFWLDSGRAWRRVEARGMEPIRWTLGLLALGRHPTMTLGPR